MTVYQQPYPRFRKGKIERTAATPTEAVQLRADGFTPVDHEASATDAAAPAPAVPPSENAPKALWVKWAVDARDLTEADADSMTKADLIALAAPANPGEN